jgi:N-acetylmuramoyl-L-alanine amidase
MNFVKPRRKVDKVFLHCTAYANRDLFGMNLVNAINEWHQNRGFSQIGYHYVIDLKGTLLFARPPALIPAAQYGHNSRSIAICLDGLFLDNFTTEEYNTLYELALEINESYEGKITFHGHCEVSNKTCPVFDYKRILGLDREGYLRSKDSNYIVEENRRVLSLTCVGESVKELQRRLQDHGYRLIEDGMFGRATLSAVISFQRRFDLLPDGIVGPMTWAELNLRNRR